MKNKVVSSALWYTVGNVLNKGIAFLTVPIFARILSKADFGDYSNYSTWAGVFASVLPLSLASSLATARYDYGDRYEKYVSSVLLLSNVVCLAVGAFLFIFIDFAEGFLSLDRKYIYLMVAYLFFLPAFSIFVEMNRLEYKYKLVLALSLSVSVLSTVSSVIFTVRSADQVAGRIFGYQIPMILLHGAVYLYLLRKVSRPELGHWKYGLAISLPLVFHTLGTVVLNSSDRLMIKRFCGSEDMAYYSVAYTVSMMIYIVVVSLNEAISPWVVDCMYQKKQETMVQWFKKIIVFYFLVLNLVILLSPEILLVAGGREYYSAKNVMPPVIGSYLLIFFQILCNNVLRTCKKTSYIAGATAAAAVLNLVLNYWLIPIYGYIAAAYTTLIAYLALYIIVLVSVKRLDLTRYFPVKQMLLMVAAEIVIVVAASAVYDRSVLRYSLLAVYLAFLAFYLFRNKEVIMQLIGKKLMGKKK